MEQIRIGKDNDNVISTDIKIPRVFLLNCRHESAQSWLTYYSFLFF